ncbi:MAG: TrkA family potassium uptake protein [Lachnospiraceae bacterium]|nr:TrkA family potassium uptake protein [Lachnospiraceae bacterium]
MKSVLVIGLGRFGTYMARKMQADGHSVMCVDMSEERADAAVNVLHNIEIMDCREEDVIRTLGVDNCDLCVVAIGDDFQTTLEIVVLLKDLGARRVIARASREIHQKLLLRNGADYVVYAEKDMAERLAVRFGMDDIFDYIQLSEDMGVYEIRTPENWIGKSVAQLNVRAAYHVNILGSKRDDLLTPMIAPDYIFNPEDSLYVMGDRKHIRKLVHN